VTSSRFLDVNMPDRFVLECLTAEGDWIDWGTTEPLPLRTFVLLCARFVAGLSDEQLNDLEVRLQQI
jgi:hypothetical protein